LLRFFGYGLQGSLRSSAYGYWLRVVLVGFVTGCRVPFGHRPTVIGYGLFWLVLLRVAGFPSVIGLRLLVTGCFGWFCYGLQGSLRSSAYGYWLRVVLVGFVTGCRVPFGHQPTVIGYGLFWLVLLRVPLGHRSSAIEQRSSVNPTYFFKYITSFTSFTVRGTSGR
jgi:uncharacterized membrane protein